MTDNTNRKNQAVIKIRLCGPAVGAGYGVLCLPTPPELEGSFGSRRAAVRLVFRCFMRTFEINGG